MRSIRMSYLPTVTTGAVVRQKSFRIHFHLFVTPDWSAILDLAGERSRRCLEWICRSHLLWTLSPESLYQGPNALLDCPDCVEDDILSKSPAHQLNACRQIFD